MIATALMLLAPLTIVVDGVEGTSGDFYVSVQTADQYMQNDGVAGSIEEPAPGTMTFEYDVPPGTYAISIWHDDNDNGQFDRDDSGWPVDGWALSGDGYNFDDVKVKVGSGGKTVRMDMSYPD